MGGVTQIAGGGVVGRENDRIESFDLQIIYKPLPGFL